MARKKLFTPVAPAAYLFYANATKAHAAFNARLECEMSLLAVAADDSWVVPKLEETKTCLSATLPDASAKCAFCDYGVSWKGACA